MSNFEVSMGKIAHIKWRIKLADFMHGQVDLTEADVKNHLDCEFGKWLYSSGLKKFEHLSTMKLVEQDHKMIHDEIKRIIVLPKEKREMHRQKIINDFEIRCDHFIVLLDKLNSEV